MLETILTTHQLPIWAEEYSRSVVAAYRPDCVILFGSVARGTQTQDSDIDILVIGGDLPADHRGALSPAHAPAPAACPHPGAVVHPR